MPEDYAKAVGAAMMLTINGREYQVSKFTPRDIGDIQAWLKSEIPDPRLEARKMLDGLPDAVAISIWRTMAEEAKNWPPTLGDERANQLLTTSTEGVARLIWVTLRKHNGIDLEKARELANTIEIDEVNELVRLASPESADVPKA